jgi:cation diffusion facilitator CzcD-associated flavoprotein CzcO
MASVQEFDVVIIGAGISGINFAYRLQERNPELSVTVLEGRKSIGGTWDFFKFPGLRSDSDLYTFGFPWRPWNVRKAIAGGPLIMQYLRASAAEHGIDKKVWLSHHVNSANWSSKERRWHLDVTVAGNEKSTGFKCKFMLFCTGYYVC